MIKGLCGPFLLIAHRIYPNCQISLDFALLSVKCRPIIIDGFLGSGQPLHLHVSEEPKRPSSILVVLNTVSNILKNASWPYWTVSIAGSLLFLLLFLWREQKWKGKMRKQQAVQQSWQSLELHAFQAQLDPAFIFNSLTAIHHFILTTSTDEASRHLMSFAKLMRLTIENSRREWIPLSAELEALELYIQLEQLRFDKKFTCEIRVMPGLSREQIMLPPFIIQPYAQNAIYRRLLMRQQPSGGHLYIEIGRNNHQLYIRLEDNGVHRGVSLTPEAGTEGADIAAERIQLMNVRYDTHAEISTRHIYDHQRRVSGTFTIITLPDTSLQPAAAQDKVMVG